ncbi:MAG: hypothetical protein ACOX8U_09430 [Bradymonadia bacterium]|jgi:predicted component of viral defense system (DUF524 family)
MPNSEENAIISEKIAALLEIFDADPALWVSLSAVAQNPQNKLLVSTPFVGVGSAHAIEAAQLGRSAIEQGSIETTKRQKHFMARGAKWRFLRVFDRRVERSTDIPANRFVSYFVRKSIQTLKHYASIIPNYDLDYDYLPAFLYIIRRLNAIYDSIEPAMRRATLLTLPLDDQVLNFDPKYRRILNAYLALDALV